LEYIKLFHQNADSVNVKNVRHGSGSYFFRHIEDEIAKMKDSILVIPKCILDDFITESGNYTRNPYPINLKDSTYSFYNRKIPLLVINESKTYLNQDRYLVAEKDFIEKEEGNNFVLFVVYN
jgi:hypothetical protein